MNKYFIVISVRVTIFSISLFRFLQERRNGYKNERVFKAVESSDLLRCQGQ